MHKIYAFNPIESKIFFFFIFKEKLEISSAKILNKFYVKENRAKTIEISHLEILDVKMSKITVAIH